MKTISSVLGEVKMPNMFQVMLVMIKVKGAYSVRNFEEYIFSKIIYIKVEHLENVVEKIEKVSVLKKNVLRLYSS